jgi:hypothetical protein
MLERSAPKVKISRSSTVPTFRTRAPRGAMSRRAINEKTSNEKNKNSSISAKFYANFRLIPMFYVYLLRH